MKTIDIIEQANAKRERQKRKPFVSHYNYTCWVKHQIQAAKEFPIKATTTEGGTCVICGEDGRCPGWHTQDDLVLHQLSETAIVVGKLFDALTIAEGIVDWALSQGRPVGPHLELIRRTMKATQQVVEKERRP